MTGLPRVFLGTQQPALLSAAHYLLSTYRNGSQWPLQNVVVVVPGGRAGRRLLEILVATANTHNLALFAPTIVTVGRLPELLYPPKRPFANNLTQHLAWARVVKEFDRQRARLVIRALPPAGDDHLWPPGHWLELGELLARQHRALAGDGLNFRHVASEGSKLPGFDEHERWQVLAEMQEKYLRTLDDLELWDIQTARLVAVEQRECATSLNLVLLGSVDMDRTMRNMLDQVANRTTALIFAPQEWASRFDTHGCLEPLAWQEAAPVVPLASIRVAAGPSDQADAVLQALAAYGGAYRTDEITIGVPDTDLVPALERRFREQQIPVRYGPGTSASESPPARFLEAAAAYLVHPGFREFAALVRQADVSARLTREQHSAAWLAQLDTFFAAHLPARLMPAELGGVPLPAPVAKARQAMEQLLEPLTRKERLPLAEWGEVIGRVLLALYGPRELQPSKPADALILGACEAIAEAIAEHAAVPPSLQPHLSAAEAIDQVLGAMAQIQLPAPANPQAIELLGWLELPLDDSPALVVTSFNEGVVPESLNSDLFLPNALRVALGVVDNSRRFARDAYALAVLAASRQSLTLIAGRRDAAGDPLLPSRLLLQCPRHELPARISTLLGDGRSEEDASVKEPRKAAETGTGRTEKPVERARAKGGRSQFEVPLPPPTAPVLERLSVTDFKAYLDCPYRFFLRRVLKLQSQSDEAAELDGLAFGNLAHEALSQFAKTDACHATDAAHIEAALLGEFDKLAEAEFGGFALPAVYVQLEQMRARLRALAVAQARWAAQGWRMRHTELSFREGGAGLLVDGQVMPLSGRIDRIDENVETGAWAILDYKTSDGGNAPDKTHRRAGEWIDLQLPLYRHLVAELKLPEVPQLGYILLPKDIESTKFAIAPWSESDLAAADEAAANVVRQIRSGQFWPPAEKSLRDFDDFASICQTGVFERRLAAPPREAP